MFTSIQFLTDPLCLIILFGLTVGVLGCLALNFFKSNSPSYYDFLKDDNGNKIWLKKLK